MQHRSAPSRAALLRANALLVAVLLLALSFALAPDAPSRLARADDADDVVPPPRPRRTIHAGFATSAACVSCHSNSPRASAMRDADGDGVAPFDLWRSSMMAQSFRDPLWRAVVSREAAATPAASAEIEAECATCHAPMAHRAIEVVRHGEVGLSLLDADTPLGDLARDGASCTTCHRIADDGLGEARTFSGRFVLDPGSRIFGPHARPFDRPMRMHTGYVPLRGDHVLDAGLCATCHTLYTHPRDAAGEPVATAHAAGFPEQTPFLEWRNSSFSSDTPGSPARTCQDCHLPATDDDGRRIETRIARNPGGRDFPPVRARSRYGRHLLVGGNTLVPAILARFEDEFAHGVDADAFAATIDAARRQLRERTAGVRVVDARLRLDDEAGGARLEATIEVLNRTGHKFPTGVPLRRAWLRLRVRDARGADAFVSGALDDRGRIVDAGGAPLPFERRGGPVAPHVQRVTSPADVVTYEAVLAGGDGRPTFLLTRAAAYVTDDRLLPSGWSAEHPDAAVTAPVGTGDDPDFVAGSDRVGLSIPIDPARAPFEVEATLLYQTLSARWEAEILASDTPETRRLSRYLDAVSRAPEVVGVARREVRAP